MRRRAVSRTLTQATAVLSIFFMLCVGMAVMNATRAGASVPIRCVLPSQVLPVASGGYTNYSLDPNGGVWAWGDNSLGQVGNGGANGILPVPVDSSGLNGVQALAAGFEDVLVLRQDGTVWGWGWDQYGQLGDGRSGTGVYQTAPEQVPGLTNVVALAVGQTDSFAIKSDGTVWGWGQNASGELADGSTAMRTVPEQIVALTGFNQISIRTAHALGLKNGAVWAWGRNPYGELGSGVPIGTNQLAPVLVPGVPAGVTGIATGTDHSVALASGQVWSWGYNAYGQLGNGSTNNSSTPVQASGVSGIAQISAGDWFTDALSSSGNVVDWGDNYYGELGNGTTTTPQSTQTPVSTSSVTALGAGDDGSIALRSGGDVWDWGNNDYGSTGNGTSTPGNPTITPYHVSVAQAVPAAPRNLSAAAGNGVAYLNWTAPTSAVTQYVVTPYLNGVAQPQVAAPVTAVPLGAPPGTTSSYTVSGLTPGGNYTFTIAGQNCLGAGSATSQSSSVIPTGPQLGDQSSKMETSKLTDRMTLHVNAFNGNLALSEHDVGIRGTELDLSLDRTYNGEATSTSTFGHSWTSTLNASLAVLGDGSVMFNGPGGAQAGYSKNADGSYTAPSGADSTLVKNADGTYTLTNHARSDNWNFTTVGALTSHTDRNGNAITFAHAGPGGAVSSVTDTQGRVTTVAYNASNLVASMTDPGGRLYQYAYDSAQNLTTYTDPGGGITRFVYDGNHHLTQITTPAGRVVTIGYDASQRVVTIGHPNQTGNPTTRFAFTAPTCTLTNSCTVVTDADGHTTTYTFDAVGRIVQVNDGLGNKTGDTYTSDSNVATYSTGNGAQGGAFGYDSRNNLNSAQVASGSHSTLGYTDPNHPFAPTTATDPQNNTTTFAYDTKGNPVTETDPLTTQNQVQVTYNANGTMATSKDPDGHVTSYAYDGKGNLTSATPPAPLGARSFVDDMLSRPTKLTDGKGQATSYAYDALDRVTTVTYANSGTVKNVYDADGNLTSMTDATGQTTMTYDAMARLTKRTTPDGKSVSYTYDGVGNMLTLADAGGTTTYTYNAANLPVSVTDAGGALTTLGYDANYNRTSVAYPNGATQLTTYDSDNRLISSKITQSLGGGYGTPNTYSYTPSASSHASGRAITVRGTPSTFGSNGTTTSSVTLATPAGTVAGDVEIAQISIASNAAVSSVPAGWTTVRSDMTGSTVNDLRQAIYYHVAGAAEPVVNSWGLSQATYANGGLSAWTGVDPNSPVESSAGQVNAAASTSWTAPSLSFTNAELNLAFFGGRLTGGATPLSVPANYTEGYDTQTGWTSVGLDSKVMGAQPGSTGTQTVTGPSAAWIGQQVLMRPIYDTSLLQSDTADGGLSYDALNRLTSTAGSAYQYGYDGASNRTSQQYVLNQGMTYSYNAANELTKLTKPVVLRGTTTNSGGTTSTSLSLAKPAGTNPGDVLFAQVDLSGTGTITAPSGWTVIDTKTSGVTEAVYWHLAGASEPTNYAWTFLAGHATSGGLAAYGGVDTTTPVDVWSTGTGTGTAMTAPAVTTTSPNDQLIATYGPAAATTVSTPTNMTKQWTVQAGSGSTSAMFDQSKGMAAGTGTRTANAGTSAGWVAHLVALRPATTESYDANGSWTGSSDGGSASYDVADRVTAMTQAGGSAMTFVYRGVGQGERASMSPALRTKGGCGQISGCAPKTKSEGTTATFENTILGVSAESDDTSTTYYVRDPRGGLLSERTPSGTYYYGFDGHGSVTDVIDSGGGDDAQYVYDPFGQITNMAQGLSVGTDNPWRYVGAYEDGTGLYHMGDRYYDPNIGRFTQQDPLPNPLDPNAWNRYAYAGDDPINFADVTGLKSGWDRFQCAVGTFGGDLYDLGSHFLGGDPDETTGLVGWGAWTAAGGYGLLEGAGEGIGIGVGLAGGGAIIAGVGLIFVGAYQTYRDYQDC